MATEYTPEAAKYCTHSLTSYRPEIYRYKKYKMKTLARKKTRKPDPKIMTTKPTSTRIYD